MQRYVRKRIRQAGVTLLELIAVIGIITLIVVGALALYGQANSAQRSNELITNLVALRSSVKDLWAGQGGYGIEVINDTLVTAKRIPSTWAVNTATTPDTITHQLNGTVTVTGATTSFKVEVTALPEDVCTMLMTAGGGGWVSVKANTGTARTPPVDPTTAAGDCGGSSANTLTFTGS